MANNGGDVLARGARERRFPHRAGMCRRKSGMRFGPMRTKSRFRKNRRNKNLKRNNFQKEADPCY